METDEPLFTQFEFDQQFEAHGGMEWDESNFYNGLHSNYLVPDDWILHEHNATWIKISSNCAQI